MQKNNAKNDTKVVCFRAKDKEQRIVLEEMNKL